MSPEYQFINRNASSYRGGITICNREVIKMGSDFNKLHRANSRLAMRGEGAETRGLTSNKIKLKILSLM